MVRNRVARPVRWLVGLGSANVQSLGLELAAAQDSKSAEELIYNAAADGDKDKVMFLLEINPALLECHWLKMTPFQIAVKQGQLGVAKLLMLRGADVFSCCEGPNGEVPLNLAIRHGHRAIVGMLLDRGAERVLPGGLVALLFFATDIAIRCQTRDSWLVLEILLARGVGGAITGRELLPFKDETHYHLMLLLTTGILWEQDAEYCVKQNLVEMLLWIGPRGHQVFKSEEEVWKEALGKERIQFTASGIAFARFERAPVPVGNRRKNLKRLKMWGTEGFPRMLVNRKLSGCCMVLRHWEEDEEDEDEEYRKIYENERNPDDMVTIDLERSSKFVAMAAILRQGMQLRVSLNLVRTTLGPEIHLDMLSYTTRGVFNDARGFGHFPIRIELSVTPKEADVGTTAAIPNVRGSGIKWQAIAMGLSPANSQVQF